MRSNSQPSHLNSDALPLPHSGLNNLYLNNKLNLYLKKKKKIGQSIYSVNTIH